MTQRLLGALTSLPDICISITMTIAYLELPSEVLDSMGDFTVEFDFRLTDLNVTGSSPTNTIIAGSSSFEEGEFAISYEEASEAIIVALKGSGAVFEIALTNNVWYCLQMVRDGSIVTVLC